MEYEDGGCFGNWEARYGGECYGWCEGGWGALGASRYGSIRRWRVRDCYVWLLLCRRLSQRNTWSWAYSVIASPAYPPVLLIKGCGYGEARSPWSAQFARTTRTLMNRMVLVLHRGRLFAVEITHSAAGTRSFHRRGQMQQLVTAFGCRSPPQDDAELRQHVTLISKLLSVSRNDMI